MSTEWDPYPTSDEKPTANYVHVVEPPTCGNCKNFTNARLLECGKCVPINANWQPIPEPVAITTWGPVNPYVATDVDWLKWTQQLKTDIAKRDDLIRRMAYRLYALVSSEFDDETSMGLLSEANELLGVK